MYNGDSKQKALNEPQIQSTSIGHSTENIGVMNSAITYTASSLNAAVEPIRFAHSELSLRCLLDIIDLKADHHQFNASN